MTTPLLLIVNGLPATGKTTLAQRLGIDLEVPVFGRDGLYETLYDALDCEKNGPPPQLGQTSFALLYAIAGNILRSGQTVIVEGFFGRPELRSAEFLRLREIATFKPAQIVCRADGQVLLQRFLKRTGQSGRHTGHTDQEWVAQHKERLLRGDLTPLTIGGLVIEVDTTTAASFDYEALVSRLEGMIREGRDR